MISFSLREGTWIVFLKGPQERRANMKVTAIEPAGRTNVTLLQISRSGSIRDCTDAADAAAREISYRRDEESRIEFKSSATTAGTTAPILWSKRLNVKSRTREAHKALSLVRDAQGQSLKEANTANLNIALFPID